VIRWTCLVGLAAGCLALAGCPFGAGTYWEPVNLNQELCADGIDNNDDGDVDCCDHDCQGRSVCFAETDCTDGVDNDCDGAVDEVDSLDCAP